MRVITLDVNNKVIGEKDVGDDYVLLDSDVVSDVGRIGQIMQPDGTFTDDPTPQPETGPTIEDKINYIYYKELGVIA